MLSKQMKSDTGVAGVYVATVSNLNFPSAQGLSDEELLSELDAIIGTCRTAGMNTLVFQVRPVSDALYRSDIFPSSRYVSGTQGEEPGIDILKELIIRAHANGISVVAWVNPLRAVKGGRESLSADNPAALHPEYCVEYAGTEYYDPALPEVRELVARGCAEIVSGYDVEGVLFDDYFYPYPKDGLAFDDSASYEKYGGGEPLGDWRRSNVNALVRESYEAVKAADPNCLFGIAPFGIWSNNDGRNGGSDTRGLDAYNEIYCDALSWAEGGYIDFLAPQIYWSFDTAAAPYATLADWWAASLGNSGVALLTSNAAYRVSEWADPTELARQIEYNRSVGRYCGCLFYSYAAIAANENDVVSCIASAYKAG